MDDRKKSEYFNIYHHRAGKSEENDSENISIDLSEEEKTVNNLPYYYQYNSNDNEMLKMQKYRLRQRDLYKNLSKNQVCILPDPNIKSVDGLPKFTIFTQDFKERKRYSELKNVFINIDRDKDRRDYMDEDYKNQI